MKKAIAILTTAALLVGAIPCKAYADNPGTLLKDVNFDGAIDARDASIVLSEYARVSAGGESMLTRTQRFVADTDYDGTVTAVDASRILATYALNSNGTQTPIKTALFGITADGKPLNYQSFTVESAAERIENIKGDYPENTEFTIIADLTIYYDKTVNKVTYAVT